MLTIAVLTGLRPAMLTRTLESFAIHHPHVWDTARKVVVHNAGDPSTGQVLDRYRWDDRRTLTELLPIGQASQTLAQITPTSGLVLRLEDDWEAQPGDWWNNALTLLDDADQVRLRVASEKVLGRCAVCRGDHLHFTHNPTLMRTSTLHDLTPYTDERDAMRKFHGRRAVQLEPGVFTHIGDWSLKTNRGGR